MRTLISSKYSCKLTHRIILINNHHSLSATATGSPKRGTALGPVVSIFPRVRIPGDSCVHIILRDRCQTPAVCASCGRLWSP